jgi:hypothetical protein
MTIDEFWNTVDKVHRASGGDMDKKCKLLGAELRKLPLVEVVSFCSHFQECEGRAYNWGLWAAAYIIGGGCSDDSFWDFRSTLISMGRDTFERALADPEWLAEINYDADNAHYEGYQYVPGKIEEELNGGEEILHPRVRPGAPSGEEWPEDKVAELFPKLAATYKFDG